MKLFSSCQNLIDNPGNIFIPLIDDNAFCIIIHLFFAVFNMCFQMIVQLLRKVNLGCHFFIPFKNLDSIPTQQFWFHHIINRLFYVSQSMFYTSGKYMRMFIYCPAGLRYSKLCRLTAIGSMQCTDFHHFTMKEFRKLL